MTSPQIEDGYTRIANELLEAIYCHNFSGQEFQVIMFIIRKTYGYQKKADFISLSQTERGCKLSKNRAFRVIKGLIGKRVITVSENVDSQKRKLSINKNYQEWQTISRNVYTRNCEHFGRPSVCILAEGSICEKVHGTICQNVDYKRKKERKKVFKEREIPSFNPKHGTPIKTEPTYFCKICSDKLNASVIHKYSDIKPGTCKVKEPDEPSDLEPFKIRV